MAKRDSKGKFLKGESGNPDGVPKGLKQRSTEIREAFFDAFEKTGGMKKLIKYVNKSDLNRKEFYSFLIRLMPKEIEAYFEGEFKSGSICTQRGTSFCPIPDKMIIFSDMKPEENDDQGQKEQGNKNLLTGQEQEKKNIVRTPRLPVEEPERKRKGEDNPPAKTSKQAQDRRNQNKSTWGVV